MSALPDPVPRRPDAPAIPTGTVTFVFTDIEGSTQRWDRAPDAMEAALRVHDELLRSAIEEAGGHVFKTIGDAFCAAFARPADALAAIAAAQRALAAADFAAVDGLRVRAAVHTGTADERDGDYFGPTLNRVARLLAIAHGGQVVVSSATRELVHGNCAPEIAFTDLGEHRLKDLTRPEHVYGLIMRGLPAQFPPLRSLDASPNNLPPQLTEFVGRQTELAEITDSIAAHRLVTLVGSGGIGKTRTSLQVAAKLLDRYRDGVWFVELAPLASKTYLPSATAQALGITLPDEGDALAQLVRGAKEKNALLIFDNCEHLLESAAALIAALLVSCPRITVLASSRQSLGIGGEHIYRLPSLRVPPANAGAALSARDALQAGAVELFVIRARALDDRFVLSDENAATVAEICRRLDGIPLAIELAAARVRLLGPRQLSQRLDERFRLLITGKRDVLPRQQTLRALIDWSYELLDERERALFARLGSFVSGFVLDGAVAVGARDGLDEFDVLDVLGSLVDKSLILAEPAGDALRYRMLESTRAYAVGKLDAAGEREQTAALHLMYLESRFGAAAQRFSESTSRTELEGLLADELDDVRAALDFALAGEFVATGSALLAHTEYCWSILGLTAEGAERCEQFLARLPADAETLRAQLLCYVAGCGAHFGRVSRTFSMSREAVVHARRCGDPEILAEALKWWGDANTMLGEYTVATIALDEAEKLPVSKARALSVLYAQAHLAQKRGDLDRAADVFGKRLEHYRAAGSLPNMMGQLVNLAEVEHARGRTAQAIAYAQEALVPSRSLGERMRLALLLANLAGYYAAIDDRTGCVSAAREGIVELAARDLESGFIAVALEHLALGLALGGDLTRAAILTGYAGPVLAAHHLERGFTERTTYQRLLSLLRAGLGADDVAGGLARGAALPARDAVALGLAERS